MDLAQRAARSGAVRALRRAALGAPFRAPGITPGGRTAAHQAEPAHLLHIGKTGGTAMKEALRPVKTAGRYELLLHGHGTRLNNIPDGEPVFFVIRDPVERYVSGFNSRLREGARAIPPWTPLEKVVYERYPSADSLGRALSAEDPVERGRAAAAMMSLQHVRTPTGTGSGTVSTSSGA